MPAGATFTIDPRNNTECRSANISVLLNAAGNREKSATAVKRGWRLAIIKSNDRTQGCSPRRYTSVITRRLPSIRVDRHPYTPVLPTSSIILSTCRANITRYGVRITHMYEYTYIYAYTRPRYVRMYMRDVQTEQSHVKLVAIGVLQTRGACHLGADHGDTHGRGRRRGQQARLHPCKWCTARTVLPENCLCRIVYRITLTHTSTYTRTYVRIIHPDRMLSFCMNDILRQSPRNHTA